MDAQETKWARSGEPPVVNPEQNQQNTHVSKGRKKSGDQ